MICYIYDEIGLQYLNLKADLSFGAFFNMDITLNILAGYHGPFRMAT